MKKVSSFRRLICFLIDSIIIFSLIIFIAYLVGNYGVSFNSYVINYIYSVSLILITFVGYYVLLEYYFQKTIGKLILNTKVYNIQDSKPSLTSIFRRTLLRIVPIDPFTFILGYNLHDRFSKTKVLRS